MASRQGVVTPSDVIALGLAPENLNRLTKLGKLSRVGQGLYQHPEFPVTEHHSYVEVARAQPNGVLCLLSALSIHGIGTQMPWAVWVAIPRGRRVPIGRSTSMRVVTMSGENFTLGIEVRHFESIPVKVYSLEKTIVDCFRLRHLIGHDVPVEALRDALSHRRLDPSAFLQIADKLRARRMIEPYLEALL